MFPGPSIAPPFTASREELADADALSLELVRFGRLVARAKARFTAQHKSGGIESAAYALLVHLVGDGPQRLTALADAVHSDNSTVSRQVGALVKHGLVERRADPLDGRACLLAATEEGQRVFGEHRCQRSAAVAALLSSWPRDDVRQLVRLLGRLNTDMETFEPKPEQPGAAVRTEGSNE